jgi:hypothetical protein
VRDVLLNSIAFCAEGVATPECFFSVLSGVVFSGLLSLNQVFEKAYVLLMSGVNVNMFPCLFCC